MLWLIFVGVSVFWVGRFLWSRRKFYQLSWRLQGPAALPLIGNALMFVDSARIMQKIDHLCETYSGSYRFWLGTRFVVMFQSPEAIEAIMNSPHAMDKGNVYEFVGNGLGGNGLITSSGDEWRRHRKMLNPTIQNFNILNSFYPIFNRNMRTLVKCMEQWDGGEEFNVYSCLEACSLDMICETTFGMKMHVQEGQNIEFLDHANNLMLVIGQMILQPWLQIESIFKWSKWFPIKERSKRETRSFALRLIEKKMAEYEEKTKCNNNSGENVSYDSECNSVFGQKKQHNNFIDECVRLSLVEKSFSREDMVNESVTILLGGFETTATSVAYIVLMLAMYPEYQQQVFEEVSQIIPTRMEDVTAEHLGLLRFTNRFIKESMRLNPTVPFMTRMAKHDINIDGNTIPRGTELIMCIYSLHRHRDVWGPTGNTFDPDHFLPENLADKHPYSFLPFSAGPRNCIGMKYGHIVVRMFVCWLVRNYRFSTSLKLGDLRYRMAVTLKLDNGHMVRIARRERV